jgi:hypothetical protein
MTNVPQVSEFDKDWKDWARRLIKFLNEQEDESRYQVPHHPSTNLPSAEQDGLLIYTPDTGDLRYSSGGNWLVVQT